MKKTLYISLAFLMSLSLFTDCFAKKDISLYSQVPAAMRSEVKEAEFDLEQAEADVKLAEERVKLSEMKKDLVALGMKYADTNKELAKILEKKAILTIEVKKLEAIEKASLGDKIDNILNIANFRAKEIDKEKDSILTEAEAVTLDIKMNRLTKKIIDQEKKIKQSKKK